MRHFSKSCCFYAAMVFAGIALTSAAAHAAPVVAAGYNLSVFASAPAGSSAPDSIDVAGGNVYIGYGNGVASDGTDGGTSTIVQYTLGGTFVKSFIVAGHNDGLRYNTATNQIYAVENEDENSTVTIIDPTTSAQAVYFQSPNPSLHGGGYDDIRFLNGNIYLSASSPVLNGSGVNTSQAVVQATLNNTGEGGLGGGTFTVTPILNGNASATDKVSGKAVTLNITDPDSMTVDPSGALALDDQSDAQLITIHNPGTGSQSVQDLLQFNAAGAPVNFDDTQFLSSANSTILVSDRDSNTVYALTSGLLTAGEAWSADPTDNTMGILNYATGLYTPIVTGMDAPHGVGIITGQGVGSSVPLPASCWTTLLGLGMVVAMSLAIKRKHSLV